MNEKQQDGKYCMYTVREHRLRRLTRCVGRRARPDRGSAADPAPNMTGDSSAGAPHCLRGPIVTALRLHLPTKCQGV